MRKSTLAAAALLTFASEAHAGVPTPTSLPLGRHARAADVDVTIPSSADGPVWMSAARGAQAVSFALRGAAAVKGIRGCGSVLYPGAVRSGTVSADLDLSPIEGGVEGLVSFRRRPAQESLSWNVDVSNVAGLRYADSVLEMLDEAGTPMFRIGMPQIVDTNGISKKATLDVLGCAFDTSAAATTRGVVGPGARSCELVIRWGDALGETIAYPAVVGVRGDGLGYVTTPPTGGGGFGGGTSESGGGGSGGGDDVDAGGDGELGCTAAPHAPERVPLAAMAGVAAVGALASRRRRRRDLSC
ncbi:MAG TPA: hypothetical protein VL400_07545 [Polyangiaceae bacterium]|nr:hypothetical protein [Polyangiaceae bacterium]